MISRSSLAAVSGLAVAALVGACGSAADTADDGKIVVVASTNVWASVVQAVGGDAVTVRSVLGENGDPHGYESKPADIVAFDGAKLAVSNGGGYDDFFPGLADTAAKDSKRIVAVDVAKQEDHAHDEHGHTDAAPAEAATDGGHHHDHSGGNEHVWYDFETVRGVADRVADELSAIDPGKKDAYQANATALGGKLDALTEKAEAIGAAHPGAKVIATEPVAGYLLQTAGLTDATPADFAKAVEEESDPSAAAVADTNALLDGHQVIAVLYNEQTETPVTKALKDKAAAASVPVVAVSETMPSDVGGYVEWMTKQVDALSSALAA